MHQMLKNLNCSMSSTVVITLALHSNSIGRPHGKRPSGCTCRRLNPTKPLTIPRRWGSVQFAPNPIFGLTTGQSESCNTYTRKNILCSSNLRSSRHCSLIQEFLPGHISALPEEATSAVPTSISPSTSAPILPWAGIPTLTAQRSAATTSTSLDAPCPAATSSISTTADQPPSAISYIVPTWAIST